MSIRESAVSFWARMFWITDAARNWISVLSERSISVSFVTVRSRRSSSVETSFKSSFGVAASTTDSGGRPKYTITLPLIWAASNACLVARGTAMFR